LTPTPTPSITLGFLPSRQNFRTFPFIAAHAAFLWLRSVGVPVYCLTPDSETFALSPLSTNLQAGIYLTFCSILMDFSDASLFLVASQP